MLEKEDFISSVDELGRSLCKGLSGGQLAVVAQSEIVVLRSEKNLFDTVDQNYTNVACQQCEVGVNVSAQVLLGKSLKEDFESWECSEESCRGACIVSAQVNAALSTTLTVARRSWQTSTEDVCSEKRLFHTAAFSFINAFLFQVCTWRTLCGCVVPVFFFLSSVFLFRNAIVNAHVAFSAFFSTRKICCLPLKKGIVSVTSFTQNCSIPIRWSRSRMSTEWRFQWLSKCL